MKFYQKLDGSAHVGSREYDIAPDTAIVEGQLVKIRDGLVVAVDADERDAILGIAAENHSGKVDALDPRANGKRIFVIDDPTVVMQCAAPLVTAAGGSKTTLQAPEMCVFSFNDFKGGYVKLVRKAEGSENTDAIGQVRRIKAFYPFVSDLLGDLILEEGGTPSEGDVYAVFPPIGFSTGSIGDNGTALTLDGSANLPVMVMGRDLGLGKINLIAKKHLFAASGA